MGQNLIAYRITRDAAPLNNILSQRIWLSLNGASCQWPCQNYVSTQRSAVGNRFGELLPIRPRMLLKLTLSFLDGKISLKMRNGDVFCMGTFFH